MKDGGNVFDAAISALFCNSLTQVQSMGLLGGFILTVYIKSERKSFYVDAQITSPKNFEFPPKVLNDVKKGGLAIGTPGFLKGLWEIHKKHGSVPWKNLMQPTLNLCNQEIVISKHLYDSMYINSNIANDSYLKELFIDKDTEKFKRPGTKYHPKKQCEFLKVLANHTASDIYSDGSVVDLILKDLGDVKSVVTRDDFEKYRLKWDKSIEYPLTETDSIFVPNTAAVLVPAIINILKQFQLNSSSFDSAKNLNYSILTHHKFVETFKHVFALRSKLADPDYVNVNEIVNYLLSADYAEHVKTLIDDEKTFDDPEKYSAKFLAPINDGTSHISIISANGDAISVTSSINY